MATRQYWSLRSESRRWVKSTWYIEAFLYKLFLILWIRSSYIATFHILFLKFYFYFMYAGTLSITDEDNSRQAGNTHSKMIYSGTV